MGEILLQPGEEIDLRCLHGVMGCVRCRELLPNGRRRRKSKGSGSISQ